nr:DUF4145 domain-containing protein [Phascolarctobacterium succinatutens]
MASGFSFLRTQFPGLEKTGEFAERYLYSDSNSCLFKLGLLCEDIVNKMFDFDNIAMPYQMKDTLVNKIRLLENEEYITEDLARIMHRLRLGGNEARHEGTDSLQKAKLLLPQATVFANGSCRCTVIIPISPRNIIYRRSSRRQPLLKLTRTRRRKRACVSRITRRRSRLYRCRTRNAVRRICRLPTDDRRQKLKHAA